MDLDSEAQGSGKIDTAIPRQLVLDYLLHNCYGETARAFMKDDLDTGDDADVRRGQGAHAQGLNGNTNGTTSRQDAHHPNGNGTANGQGQGIMPRNASVDTQRRTGSSASLMMETDRDEVDPEGDSPMGESILDSDTGTLAANGTDALHADERLMNLETRKAIRSLISRGDIGSAIDLCNCSFPGVLSTDPSSPLTSPKSIHMNFKLQCQKFIELIKSDTERGPEALMFAQNVIQDFRRLDPAGEETYLKQMHEIVSLIAYANPEDSPYAHHLKQEAREQLADIMNSAILRYNGMSCEPALLTIVKQAAVVQDQLNALDSTKQRRQEPKACSIYKRLQESPDAYALVLCGWVTGTNTH
ncbi:CTLH/CRA C-terminal to lish motif domain-containing protein [Mortierella sp. GBAus27b]|nr:CTLH/CRA C-terminal to lish motif domain-containing protein [Mortierella sp. GBAus27b]